MLKAMADPTRQRLLRLLSCHELTVSELVEVLDQPQSTVSRHLKVLRECGLLTDRRFGNSVRYAALPPNPVLPGGKAGVNGHNDPGHVAALRDRLLDWAGQVELDEVTCGRLEIVLNRRRAPGWPPHLSISRVDGVGGAGGGTFGTQEADYVQPAGHAAITKESQFIGRDVVTSGFAVNAAGAGAQYFVALGKFAVGYGVVHFRRGDRRRRFFPRRARARWRVRGCKRTAKFEATSLTNLFQGTAGLVSR